MELRRVAVALPCDGLGDFPTFLTACDAAASLHTWTAAWHPALVAAAGKLPAVWSAFDPPDAASAAGALVLAPKLAAMPDLADWREDAHAHADPPPVVLEGLAHRDAIIAAVREAGFEVAEGAQRFAPDFFALGYAYLQTELLTQSLQYASIIEPDQLEARIVAAARAAVAGDDGQVDDSLRGAYDLLEQARNHTYPVELCLVDAVLVGETTLGARLERELAETTPKCFLVPADVARLVAREHTGLRAPLGDAELVFTPPWDAQDDGTPPELMRRGVLDGLRDIEETLGQRPSWYAHRASDLPPRLPAVLREVQCRGALLAPLDGGAAPGADQPRCLWTGVDGATVEALAVPARDASSADTLLLHAQRLGDSLYSDRVTTVLFAAWAGCRHELYDDLRRVAQRSNVLGEFVTLEKYFGETDGAGAEARFDRAHGRAPRGVDSQPDSGADYAEEYAASLRGLTDLACVVSDQPRAPDAAGPDELTRTLARVVTGAPEGDAGVLVANAWSYPRHVLLAAPGNPSGLCDLLESRLVADVPGAGFRVVPARPTAASTSENTPARASGGEVQNELLLATLDPSTGGVRSLKRHARRGNRLSQKLIALNPRRHVETPTEVRGVSVETLLDAPDRGAVAASGELVDSAGRVLARFRQTLVLFANWNRLFLDIELDATGLEPPPMGPPRLAYRVAWPDEECRIFRGNQWAREPVSTRWIDAREYVHLEVGADAVTIADTTHGVRRRVGARMLDTLLPHATGGVSRSRVAIALGERRPLRVALDLASQRVSPAGAACGAAPRDAWLAHVDAANVMITAIERPPADQPTCTLRLMETEGRAADARVRFARTPSAAHALDDQGARAAPLELDGDAVVTPLAAYEWRGVEVTW